MGKPSLNAPFQACREVVRSHRKNIQAEKGASLPEGVAQGGRTEKRAAASPIKTTGRERGGSQQAHGTSRAREGLEKKTKDY